MGQGIHLGVVRADHRLGCDQLIDQGLFHSLRAGTKQGIHELLVVVVDHDLGSRFAIPGKSSGGRERERELP